MAFDELIKKNPPPPRPKVLQELEIPARLAADIEKVRRALRLKAKRIHTFEEVLLQLTDEGLAAFRRWEAAQDQNQNQAQ